MLQCKTRWSQASMRKHVAVPSSCTTDESVNSCMPSCKLSPRYPEQMDASTHACQAASSKCNIQPKAMTHLKAAPHIQHSNSRHDCSCGGPARLHNCQAPHPRGSPARTPSPHSMAQGAQNQMVDIDGGHTANQNAKTQASQAPQQRDVCCW